MKHLKSILVAALVLLVTGVTNAQDKNHQQEETQYLQKNCSLNEVCKNRFFFCSNTIFADRKMYKKR